MIKAVTALFAAVETTANVVNKSVQLLDNELLMLEKQQQLRSVELDQKLAIKANALGITL
jgi:hypothetical protein